MPDESIQEEPLSYKQAAEECLRAAAEEPAPEHKVSRALEGIGWAILANGEDSEHFFGMFGDMFRGPDGKAQIDAWTSRG